MSVYPLVLGTRNEKKRLELEQLLSPYGFELRTLDECERSVEVEETGQSFAENAALKASQQARATGNWVLGEDSGLAVDALDGAPGIRSARFAGDAATDEENNDRLLEALRGVPTERRGAMYVCHLSLANPGGEIRLSAEATCRGRIGAERRGAHGFGYDPLFIIPEYHRTFGELGPVVKSALSHRSRAMRIFLPRILALRDEWTTATDGDG
ncbi:MAG: RdgB/HAM1 family non-canonical purine NTP pyrophosphatase [Planctomycetales bacterium]|nr:RdgB/HAM1 family non-canonical purine NTP pyrophosphatase [Planctomycetales bacterium]